MKNLIATLTTLTLGFATLAQLTLASARGRLKERARDDEGGLSIEAAIIAAVLILLAGLLVVKLTGAFENRSEGIS